jgi:hypothetical protein
MSKEINVQHIRIIEKVKATPICNELIEEIVRGIRLHFTKFLNSTLMLYNE